MPIASQSGSFRSFRKRYANPYFGVDPQVRQGNADSSSSREVGLLRLDGHPRYRSWGQNLPLVGAPPRHVHLDLRYYKYYYDKVK